MINCHAVPSKLPVAGWPEGRRPRPKQEQERRGVKRDWTADELIEHWTLLPGEKPWRANKAGLTRLGFAVLLKFFQHEGRFPQQPQEIPEIVVAFLARQVGVEPTVWPQYRWQGRTIEYQRAQIRKRLGFREATVEDAEALSSWLRDHVHPQGQSPDRLYEGVRDRCRALHIEPPTPERIDRLVRSAVHAFEGRFCAATLKRLSPQSRERLEALLLPNPPSADGTQSDLESGRAVLTELHAD